MKKVTVHWIIMSVNTCEYRKQHVHVVHILQTLASLKDYNVRRVPRIIYDNLYFACIPK